MQRWNDEERDQMLYLLSFYLYRYDKPAKKEKWKFWSEGASTLYVLRMLMLEI